MFATVVVKALEAILIAIASWVVYMIARWILTRGGAPSEEAGKVVYGLRYGMRILSYGFTLFGVWLLWCAWLARRDVALSSIELVFGGACLLGGGFILSTRMVLDQTGIHYLRWPDKRTTIAWDSLDHYEIMRNNRVASNVYFLRCKNGESIGITDTAYNVGDLMARIQERVPLRKQPYIKRKWYGG